MTDDTIVIVGGGRAAASVVAAYREQGGEAQLTVISDDTFPPYNRPPLSKGFLRGDLEADAALAHPHSYYGENRVELRLATRVTGVDPQSHVIELEGGERLTYGTLVLASGARPRALPVPGAELPQVLGFRTIADAQAVRELAAGASSALVIGGSFIGAEVAASLRTRGLEVTLIEAGDRLMPALTSDALSQGLLELYRDHGVQVILGDGIGELTARDGVLTGAMTASGRHIDAELAVFGIGVMPNIEFLDGSGIEVANGVVVDESFRTSIADVYAVGDVASYPDAVSGASRRIEHWSAANAQGAHLGRQLAGVEATYAEVPVFFTQLFDLKLQVIGDNRGTDDVVLRGGIADRRLLGFYLRDDVVRGAVVSGEDSDVVSEVVSLVREGARVQDRERLAAPGSSPAEAFA